MYTLKYVFYNTIKKILKVNDKVIIIQYLLDIGRYYDWNYELGSLINKYEVII